MGMTESQGTKAYLVDLGTDLGFNEATNENDPAKVKTAIASAKEIDLIVELGDLALGSRSATEKTLINRKANYKFLGSYSIGNITPQLIFDAADTEGQKILKDMWKKEQKKVMIVVFNDQITPTTGNPTSISFTAAISSPTIGVPKDDAITYTPTIEMMDLPVLTEAK